jgi:hypothetical protein
MQDEGTQPDSELTVAELEQRTDRMVLMLLLDEPGLWSLDEISREISTVPDVEDGINRLHAVGLVHKLDQFAFATRAAVRGQRLVP